MTGIITSFNDPEVLCFGVPAVRRYWASLLKDCIDKHAQEHPLYSLFSSVLSTLAMTISVPGSQVSPLGAGDSILFSYPQCRVVDKRAVGSSEYNSISTYPDFALIHRTTEQSPKGKIQVEYVRLFMEIKRLYRSNDKCIWDDKVECAWAVDSAIYANTRQLLLQAYCAFSVYKQSEVFIMLIPGVHFTLFKFQRPDLFEPLPQVPTTLNKKRKLEVAEETTDTETSAEKPKCRSTNETTNSQLTDLIPLENIEVIYHCAPVFEDYTTRELRLSDAFRQALHEQLVDVNFQPCSLFDLETTQYRPEDGYKVRLVNYRLSDNHKIFQNDAVCSLYRWYSNIQTGGHVLKTPERSYHPYIESPVGGKETPLSPEYQGKVLPKVSHRESIQRGSKDRTNVLRLWDGIEGLEEEVLCAIAGVSSGHQDSGRLDGEKGETGEVHQLQKGKSRVSHA